MQHIVLSKLLFLNNRTWEIFFSLAVIDGFIFQFFFSFSCTIRIFRIFFLLFKEIICFRLNFLQIFLYIILIKKYFIPLFWNIYITVSVIIDDIIIIFFFFIIFHYVNKFQFLLIYNCNISASDQETKFMNTNEIRV